MRLREIIAERRMERDPRAPRLKGTQPTFTDREGRTFKLTASKRYKHRPDDPEMSGNVDAVHEGKVIAHLSLGCDDFGTWRVKRAWVDEGFRRSGVATALYNFAFREGFRPLAPARIQSENGTAFWQAHYRKPDRVHGTRWVINRWQWSPTDGADPGRPLSGRRR